MILSQNYFKIQKLNKQFGEALRAGNIEEAKKIDAEINKLVQE
jgi:hypothetical protein